MAFKAPGAGSDERLRSPESRALNLGKFCEPGFFQRVTSTLSSSVAFESGWESALRATGPASPRGQSQAAPSVPWTAAGRHPPHPGATTRGDPTGDPPAVGHRSPLRPELAAWDCHPSASRLSAFESSSCSSEFPSSGCCEVFKIMPDFRRVG